MTGAEIIKALERCIKCNARQIASCDDCSLKENYPYCDEQLEIMCLDLINRQKAEIEELKSICDKEKADRLYLSQQNKAIIAGQETLQKALAKSETKIEALQMDNAQLQSDNINANMNLEHLQAEIERLKLITTSNPYCVSIGTADIFTENHEEYEKLLAKISAGAIKEFAERLKENTVTVKIGKQTCKVITVEGIDYFVKEMVGDTK